ncbi:MAG TPA: hypothetical protein VN697_13980 [Tepidiformaceae bacterium]|nr:hypothetical protein [Tepidiformaceae bacterium]
MQYVREAGSDPSFLLKALSEASGELRRAFYGLRRRELMAPGSGMDEGWRLKAIPFHMRETERVALDQYRMVLAYPESEIEHNDLDDIPFEEDYRDEDEDDLLEEFHYLRRQSSYLLWDLMPSDWDRGGTDPYRGRMTTLQIVREMYQHDLEHLWQVRRMMDSLASVRR